MLGEWKAGIRKRRLSLYPNGVGSAVVGGSVVGEIKSATSGSGDGCQVPQIQSCCICMFTCVVCSDRDESEMIIVEIKRIDI